MGDPDRVRRGQTHSSSHVLHRDIEEGTHSSDGIPSELRSVDPHEDTWQRLAAMVDPLLGLTFQGAFSLVGYRSSDNSSPTKVVLLYLLVFVYVFGFLSALAGKWFRCYKMGGMALLAAALGFLMTMALVVL